MSSVTACPTEHSFSFQLALRYLQKQGMAELEQTDSGMLKIGNVRFPTLTANAGGYALPPEEAIGYQILLNYRSAPPQQVALRDLLQGSVDLSKMLEPQSIVLIGVIHPTDAHSTPYSQGELPTRMPGVMVQAQMVSQLISAVLDQRSLLWWWPEWVEVVWIGGWAIGGGSLVWLWSRISGRGWRSPGSLVVAVVVGAGLISGLCFVIFLQGGWIPLVPAVMTLGLTSGSLLLYTYGGNFSENLAVTQLKPR
jgi:CHASE2 domain-containing sensor protein